MKYLDLLKDTIPEKQAPRELPKLQEAPFDSFGSRHGKHISESKGDEVITPIPYHPTPEQIEQAARELEIDLDDPVMFKGLVEMLTDKHYLDKGQVPPSYTSTTLCKGCKCIVPIFERCPQTVEACPWCHRRWQGKSNAS